VEEAKRRLVMIGDTYLSVNTPVQAGLKRILEDSRGLSEAIRLRAAANYRTIGARLQNTSITLLAAQGGWNAILRMPANRTDDEWSLLLLREFGLSTYPGHFFDLEGGVFLVVSLIVEEKNTADYLDRILTVL
jgi:aspartate/methionine/tyrosine aminotransferase